MAFENFFKAIAPKYASPLHKGRVEIIEHESGAKVNKVTSILIILTTRLLKT